MSHMLLPEAAGGHDVQNAAAMSAFALGKCLCFAPSGAARVSTTSPYTPGLRVRKDAVTTMRSAAVISLSH